MQVSMSAPVNTPVFESHVASKDTVPDWNSKPLAQVHVTMTPGA